MSMKGEVNEAVHWLNQWQYSQDSLLILSNAILSTDDPLQQEHLRVARFKEQRVSEGYLREAMQWIDKIVEPLIREVTQ